MARKAIGKTARFEIFKRDGFACQYCGAHPPAVVLEVDHIIPVAQGGGNEDSNLITACFDCNRGKRDRSLEVAPQALSTKAAEIAEREAQLKGYSEIARARRERLEDDVWSVFAHWRGQTSTTNAKFQSVKLFVDKLGVDEVIEAVDIAMGVHRSSASEFKYFCGVCWNKVREAGS